MFQLTTCNACVPEDEPKVTTGVPKVHPTCITVKAPWYVVGIDFIGPQR